MNHLLFQVFTLPPDRKKKEETGSDTKAAVTDWLSALRKKSREVMVINEANQHPLCFLMRFKMTKANIGRYGWTTCLQARERDYSCKCKKSKRPKPVIDFKH